MNDENKTLGFEKMDADDVGRVSGGFSDPKINQMFYDKIMDYINRGKKTRARYAYTDWKGIGGTDSDLGAKVREAFEAKFGTSINSSL